MAVPIGGHTERGCLAGRLHASEQRECGHVLGLTVHGAPCKHPVMPSARLFLLLHPQVKAILSAVRSKPQPARCVMVSATMTKAVKRLMGESVAATTAAAAAAAATDADAAAAATDGLHMLLACKRQYLQAWGAPVLHMWTA